MITPTRHTWRCGGWRCFLAFRRGCMHQRCQARMGGTTSTRGTASTRAPERRRRTGSEQRNPPRRGLRRVSEVSYRGIQPGESTLLARVRGASWSFSFHLLSRYLSVLIARACRSLGSVRTTGQDGGRPEHACKSENKRENETAQKLELTPSLYLQASPALINTAQHLFEVSRHTCNVRDDHLSHPRTPRCI
jgi:hypothetical protein